MDQLHSKEEKKNLVKDREATGEDSQVKIQSANKWLFSLTK